MGGIGTVALRALIAGNAEQGSTDGPPLAFGQGHGGKGLGVPGSGSHWSVVVNWENHSMEWGDLGPPVGFILPRIRQTRPHPYGS